MRLKNDLERAKNLSILGVFLSDDELNSMFIGGGGGGWFYFIVAMILIIFSIYAYAC